MPHITVNERIKKGKYHSIMIIHEKFTLILRPPKKSDKILKMPIWCEDIGWYPVKEAEIKKEGELIIYV